MITLNRKSKKIGHFQAKIGKNHYFKWEPKEIVTSKPLLSQIGNRYYFKQEIIILHLL